MVVPLLALLTALAVVVGALPAGVALRRTPREELKVESGSHPARPLPPATSPCCAASTGRRCGARCRCAAASSSSPSAPGSSPWPAAWTGRRCWSCPALVISGGALLFGVNAWCLDGRGALWRESLPVGPETVFAARALTLAEWLGAAALVTVAMAALRAGVPSATEVLALVDDPPRRHCCRWWPCRCRGRAVGRSRCSWSSARATPAPPIVMVGYSARLAVSTTLTAMLFSAAAQAPAWWLVPAMAVPFLAWSWVRLRRARRRWVDAPQRARS